MVTAIKSILIMIAAGVCLLCSASELMAAPEPPAMTISINGTSLTASWAPVLGATGYTLFYAPYPYYGEPISSLDMCERTSFSTTLWPGAAYYVAVMSYEGGDFSDYSNIEFFVMDSTTPEWVDDNGRCLPSTDAEFGDVVRQIPFPEGVSSVGDVAFEPGGAALWILAGGVSIPSSWMRLDSETGEVLEQTPNEQSFLNHSSEITHDGVNLWTTSYGALNGVSQSFIYQVSTSTGETIQQFPCPVNSLSEFCEGLAWDGERLWSGDPVSRSLSRFNGSGTVERSLTDIWEASDYKLDIDFDERSNRLIVFKNRRIKTVDLTTGATSTETYLPIGSDQIGWDGSLLWTADHSSLTIKGYFVGLYP